MTTTLGRGPLTMVLDDPMSPVRLFLEERFPSLRDIQRRYRENAPALVVAGSEANPGTVGTACDWLLRFLVHPQPDVSLALTGGGFIPQHLPGLGAALFDLCDSLGIPTGGSMPPPASERTFTGPVGGSTVEPEVLARGCWALALLTEFYRAGPVAAANSPLSRLGGETPDLLALASPAALDQLAKFRTACEQILLPALARREGNWALGPAFTGSALLHADADLIAAGLLVEVKTSQGRKGPDGTRRAGLDKVDLLQLIGYALLDFDDNYHITELALFAARHAYLVTWPLDDLLHEMAGQDVDLSDTRDAFRHLLQGRRTDQ
jgi:hypothetical protein